LRNCEENNPTRVPKRIALRKWSRYFRYYWQYFAVPANRLPKYLLLFASYEKVTVWAHSNSAVEDAERYARKGRELLYPTPISQLPEYEACEQAVPYYQEAVRRAPDYDPDWWYGYCLRHFKRDAEVVEVYERAVHFFPTESPLYKVLGAALEDLGRYREAADAFQKVIELSGSGFDPWWRAEEVAKSYDHAGQSYEKLDMYNEAITRRTAACSKRNLTWRLKTPYLTMAYDDAVEHLGRLYLSHQLYQEAISTFRQAIRVNPNSVEAHFNLGITFAATGNRKAAVEQYQLLKAVDPRRADELFRN